MTAHYQKGFQLYIGTVSFSIPALSGREPGWLPVKIIALINDHLLRELHFELQSGSSSN